jgi:hypothetical protein
MANTLGRCGALEEWELAVRKGKLQVNGLAQRYRVQVTFEREIELEEWREAPARGGTEIVRMIVVLAVALLLRLLVLVAWVRQFGVTFLFQRGLEMSWLARSLLEGKGLSSPFGVPTGPTAFIAPAYPIMVAGIFKVFGVDSSASAYVVLALHIAASLVTIWLLLMLGRRLFNERVGLVAGMFWAISPPLLFLPTIFWETSFSICLLLGLIAVALWVRQRPTLRRWTHASFMPSSRCGRP